MPAMPPERSNRGWTPRKRQESGRKAAARGGGESTAHSAGAGVCWVWFTLARETNLIVEEPDVDGEN
jgi:hypothetical protein